MKNVENLVNAGGRALGSVISKLHSLKGYGIKSYEKLFNACVKPNLDYCASLGA